MRMTLAIAAVVSAVMLSPTPAVEGGELYEWTEWLNRDSPSGDGDYETLELHYQAGRTCEAPLMVQCRTLVGKRPWRATADVYHCDVSPDALSPGGVCHNDEQDKADNYCENYEVRFLCPIEDSDGDDG